MAQTRLSARELGDGGVTTADLADLAVTDLKVATANKDGAAATPSMRTLGTGALQAVAGNDSRLSDTRAPSAHTHGNISNGGAIGVTAGIPIITGVSGVLQVGSFGTIAGTFAQGNDSRIVNAQAVGATHFIGTTSIANNRASAAQTLAGVSIGGNAATATYLQGGLIGAIPYQSALNTTAMLAAGTSGYFLKANGAAAPSWQLLDMSFLSDSVLKKSVRVATFINLTPASFSAGVMTGPIGVLTIDGVTLALNDRILLKDQTSALQNGIYYVSTLGTASVAWVLTRVVDGNTSSKIGGALVNVDSGLTNGGFLFDTDFKTTDTINTTAMAFNRVLNTGLASSVVGSTLGTASAGTSLNYARADHVHPSPTSITGASGSTAYSTNNVLVNTVPLFWGQIVGTPTGNSSLSISDSIKVQPSTGSILANKFVANGGTSAQYLMADGSVRTSTGGISVASFDTSLVLNVKNNTLNTGISYGENIIQITAVLVATASNNGYLVNQVVNFLNGQYPIDAGRTAGQGITITNQEYSGTSKIQYSIGEAITVGLMDGTAGSTNGWFFASPTQWKLRFLVYFV